MTTSIPTLADVLRMVLEQHSDGTRVALPAEVVSWSSSNPERADVRPTIRLVRRDSTGARLTFRPLVISGVPVGFPGSGSYGLTWPLQPGHTGLLVFADRSIDEWLVTGQSDNDPQHPRRHDYADGMFLPQLRPYGGLTASQVDGGAMVLSGDALHLGAGGLTAAQELAYRTSVQAQLDALEAVFTAWTPVATDGGLALKTALTALITGGWPTVSGTSKTRAQ